MNGIRMAALHVGVSLTIGLSLTSSAVAEVGRWIEHRLPPPGKPVAGFVCDVQMIDPDNYGYMPLQLTARATTSRFPADRRITVDLIPREGANWPRPHTTYRVNLDLPEGQPTVTVVHHLPKYFAGGSFEILMSEGGRKLEHYALQHHSRNGDRLLTAASLEKMVRYAIILPDASAAAGAPWARVPDMRSIDSMDVPEVSFLMSSEVVRLGDDEALMHLRLNPTPTRQVMHLSEAHSMWLGYESVDIVIVSFGVLERMRDEHPQRFKALRDWIACGGAVWTYGVENRESLAALMGATPLAASDPEVAGEILAAVQGFDTSRVIPQYDWFLQQVRYQDWTEIESAYMGKPAGERWAEWFATGHPVVETLSAGELEQILYPQPLMAGIVIGFKDPDPFPGGFQLWHVAKHLTAARQVWPLKHGTPVLSGTDRFWDWSLENVARPPVYAFLGVLTGFVLLVGPVSYHFTRRWGRTYLMFLIAPVLATLATLMLFGYGFVADGLGTQVRVRQITWADGVSNRAVRMTRSTYFAGFRPGNGLAFPLDAAVYPVIDTAEREADATHEPPTNNRNVTIGDQHQRFGGEFMPARRQRQFLTTRPIDDAGAIALSLSSGQPSGLRNDFHVDVFQLVARDSNGNYYTTAGPIVAGGEGTVNSITSNQAATLLRDLYQTQSPSPPPGYRPSGGGNLFGSPYYYQLGGSPLQNQNVSWSDPHAEFGVFESRLRTMLLDPDEFPRGWFVGRAALDTDAVAVEGATPVSSVHFIIGALR